MRAKAFSQLSGLRKGIHEDRGPDLQVGLGTHLRAQTLPAEWRTLVVNRLSRAQVTVVQEHL